MKIFTTLRKYIVLAIITLLKFVIVVSLSMFITFILFLAITGDGAKGLIEALGV